MNEPFEFSTYGLVHGTGDHGLNTVLTHKIGVSIHAQYSCISTHGNQKGMIMARFSMICAHFRLDLHTLYTRFMHTLV